MIKRAGGNGVLMGFVHTRYATNACLTALIAHRVVAPHSLAYAPISADVDRAVSCGEFREDIQEDFEVQ